jgi:chemotaxis protein methyltransferase CheR
MAFTFFFRDNTVLEAAADLFVTATMGRSRVRIWDAGCAMGPEPYTLLIMLAERMGRFSFENLRLEATDHDEGGDFGETIEAGRYPDEQISRIPRPLFEKYFAPAEGRPGWFEISANLRSKISFRRHDLLSLVPPCEGYAMIVCKNVLLHFTEEQRHEVIGMFHASLAPGGLLVMEHTQKMPERIRGGFARATGEAQIYRKENDEAIADAA